MSRHATACTQPGCTRHDRRRLLRRVRHGRRRPAPPRRRPAPPRRRRPPAAPRPAAAGRRRRRLPAARLHRHHRRRLLRHLRHGRRAGAPVAAAAVEPPAPPACSTPSRPATSSSRVGVGRLRLGPRRRRPARVHPPHRPARSGCARRGSAPASPTSRPRPPIDPAKALMPDPQVPEDKRFCSKCGNPSAAAATASPAAPRASAPSAARSSRSRRSCRPATWSPGSTRWPARSPTAAWAGSTSPATRTSRTAGWCSRACSTPATPTRSPPRSPSSSSSPQVEHPLIVEIYNFVTHEGAGYIVMEYVGGTSLKQILKERMRANGGRYDPLPVDQALAYVLEILPAFQYLHDLGLVYCDFKPDNMIQVGDAVKLIDLGGVRRIDDQDSAIYGTVGYQAPEVPQVGPCVASDLYTIGRTLVVLTMEFRGYQGTYLHVLPPPGSTAAVRRSTTRSTGCVAKCCAPDPADRFASADELRTADARRAARDRRARRDAGTALPRPRRALFDAPDHLARRRSSWRSCPRCASTPPTRSTPGSPASAATTRASGSRPLEQAPEQSRRGARWPAPAPRSRRGDADVAARSPPSMLPHDPWEWRALWVEGLAAMLAAQDWAAGAGARSTPSTGQVPGELAPKLALALACEKGGLPRGRRGPLPRRAPPPTPPTSRRPRSASRGSAPAPRATPAARSRRSTGCRRTSRGYPRAAQLRAEVLLGRPAARPRRCSTRRCARSSRPRWTRPPTAATPCGSSSTRSALRHRSATAPGRPGRRRSAR